MNVDAPPSPHPGLEASRPAKVPGVSPEPETLRRAYLELLKLCVCDLGGATTVGVGRGYDDFVVSRELAEDQVRMRAAGMDWPLQGLTMVGLTRLDDLQSCVESVVADGVEGDLIEAGAWGGGASILMRATLDSLGAAGRTVVVADSFRGFPERDDANRDADELSVFDFLAVPVEQVRENFERLGCERGVELVEGYLAHTLPGLSGRRWAVARLDGDTYEATMLSLRCLYPGLSVGGYLIVDDYGALEECSAAVDDFRSEHGITEPLEEVDWTCVRWRRKSDASIDVGEVPRPDPPAAVAKGGERSHARVPTMEELRLKRELSVAREQLAAARAELASGRRGLLGRWYR
jgi:O-methyltransferase